MEKLRRKKERRGWKWKRAMAGVITASLVLNPFSPLGSLLPAQWADAASYLPMPENPGYPLLNKKFASNDTYVKYFSMGDKMQKAGKSGKVWLSSIIGEWVLEGATVSGSGMGWSMTFEYRDFAGEVNEDTEVRFIGTAFNRDGTSLRLSNGGNREKLCEEKGLASVETDWLPFAGVKAVVRGQGEATLYYPAFAIADRYSPGEKGWEYKVEVDPEAGTPVFWVSCHETLRPANDKIQLSDLANIKVRLGLRSKKAPGKDKIYVTAEAFALSEDKHGLAFRVRESDWNRISGSEYQIASIQEASSNTKFDTVFYGRNSKTGKYETGSVEGSRPITDIAGNPVYFPSSEQNIENEQLYLDVLPPQVDAVRISGTKVDGTAVSAPEQWPEDIDRSRLFSTVGNKVQLRLQLNDRVAQLSERDMQKVRLQWNLKYKNNRPVTSKLLSIEDGYSNGVNGDVVSTLVFEGITITENMAPQGIRIGAAAIEGADVLMDYSKNRMAGSGQTADVSQVSPDCHNYLDMEGPVASFSQLLPVESSDTEALYTMELDIRDGAEGVLAAGVMGTQGKIAVTSYANAPQIEYEYEITTRQSVPDALTQRGVIGGEGNEIMSSFELLREGKYYLHLRLKGIDGKELDNGKGLTLKLWLTDVAGNARESAVQVKNLNLDKAAPTLSLLAKEPSVSRDEGTGENTAVLSAEVSAADINGINRIEYQWVEQGAEVSPNGWQIFTPEDSLANPIRESFSTQISGVNTASRDLAVRAYDLNGNCTEKCITLTADMTKAVGQFQITGNPEKPSDRTDILISRPVSTDGGTTQGTTRATVTMGSKTYIRIIDSDSPQNLFNRLASDWYEVSIAENGTYSSVAAGVTPDWNYYGNIEVALASSMQSLVPVQGESIDKAEDTTRQQDLALTVKYAPARNDAYGVTFGDVESSEGKALTAGKTGDYPSYYRQNQTMTGVRFRFAVQNALISEWNREDLDFENSYAVLHKTDRTGQILTDEGGEATQRVRLSDSQEQIFSVPALDKDGQAFATGAYALHVHVAQKAGGAQDFYFDKLLLLDTLEIPETFGILEYEGSVHALYTDYDGFSDKLEWQKRAPEGEVLDTVNLGVARPGAVNGEYGDPDVREIDGHPAYVVETQNSLQNSRDSRGGTWEVSLEAVRQDSIEEETWLGVQLGKVTGMRYWNAQSAGSLESLDYTSFNMNSGTKDGKGAYSLKISQALNWYNERGSSVIVPEEELLEKNISDFALKLGTNTICYQLIMENGVESPVYQFRMNLCTAAPEIELEYECGPSVYENIEGWGNNGEILSLKKIHADYIDVSIKHAFSPNGGLKYYHAYYGHDETQKKSIWKYDEIPVDGKVRLTKNGDGYKGSQGTSTGDQGQADKNPVREFICVDDAVGNAACAYPILSEINNTFSKDNARYCFGIRENNSLFNVSLEEPDENGRWYLFQFDGMASHTVKEFSLQLDDREPTIVQPSRYDDDYGVKSWDGPNPSGVVAVYSNSLGFVLPYDPERPEGEEVTHTVTLTGRCIDEGLGMGKETETVSYTITAPNTKPRAELVAGYDEPGRVRVLSNTYIRETGREEFAFDFDIAAFENGPYELTYEDKFGQVYTETLNVQGLEEDPKVTVSETKPTDKPVVVTVTSDRYLLSLDPYADRTGLTVTGEGTGALTVTASQNKEIYLYYKENESDEDSRSLGILINNIYDGAMQPEVQWSFADWQIEEGNVLYGEATAYLVDKKGNKLVDPLTGKSPQYTFVPGGETEYIFQGYTNAYGTAGPDIRAALPVTLRTHPIKAEETDTWKPDLALTGYALQNGISREAEAAYMLVNERPEGSRAKLPEYGDKYGEENVFYDMESFLQKMGWAESYLFRIDAEDESAVRLFVKTDADGPVPSYASGRSDTVEGVTLTGRTLQVDGNVSFALYAVDERGNYSVVQMEVASLGDAPLPNYTQVLTKTGDEVRIYLLPPNVEGTSDLRITNDDNNDKIPDAVTEDDPMSLFRGIQYLSVRENKTVVLRYSYMYEGQVCEGELHVRVTGIDKNPPSAVETEWSANYDPDGARYTNEPISVQISYDKNLGEVNLTDAAGNPLTAADGVTVTWLENRVTVIYDQNAAALGLECKAAVSGRIVKTDLPAIRTIDREAPQAALRGITYGSGHKSADITLVSNEEESILQENGARGREFTVKVKENGTFVYHIADRAGNISEVSVTVDEIVEGQLTVTLSSGGTDASVIDPESYQAAVGQNLFVKTNRKAEITVNGAQAAQAEADAWTQITLTADSEGLYPSIRAVDEYGNAAVVQLLRIPMGDRKAPTVLVKKSLVSASAAESDATLDTLLKENITASDETTPKDRLRVTVEYDRESRENKIPVTYRVEDEAGNETTEKCYLRLYSGDEPCVTVNGEAVEWDETKPVAKGTQLIEITSNGENYKVEWKKGIKTEAQMKNGSSSLCGYTKEKNNQKSLTLNESGYYTFCITTQGRGIYRFVLYVEE